MKKQNCGVCRPARILAWIAALLLVPMLTGTLYGWFTLRAVTDEGLHERIFLRDEVIGNQIEQIDGEAEKLGEAYGFNPDIIRESLSRETLTELNRQVVAWWTRMLATGVPEDMPLWDGQALRDRLLNDDAFLEAHGALARDSAGKIVSSLNNTLSRLLFPMRELLITEGLEVVRRKIALSEIIDLMQGIPLALTLMSAATAGLILLLTARDGRTVRRHIGSALGGAGILSLCVLIMVRLLNLSGLIQESSARLASQVGLLENVMSLEILAAILILLAGGWLCLRNGRQKSNHPAGGEPV